MTDTPNPIDIHVGQKIKLRRTLLGMSQSELAEGLGLTFQQVQKYEKGANRVSASKMWKLRELLNIPVSFFFDGLETDSIDPETISLDREALKMIRTYRNIPSQKVRARFHSLLAAIAGEEDDQEAVDGQSDRAAA